MATHLSWKAKEATVGELAERAGVATSALRFYEREGLIRSRRTSGNQRRYSRDTLRRVAFIRASQRLGIPLAAIRDALSLLPEGRTPTRDDWAAVSECWREDLNQRIALLEQLRDHLTDCIGCGCLSLTSCALVNPQDRLGQEGPGARQLAQPCGPEGPTPANGTGRAGGCGRADSSGQRMPGKETPEAETPGSGTPRKVSAGRSTQGNATAGRGASGRLNTSRADGDADGPVCGGVSEQDCGLSQEETPRTTAGSGAGRASSARADGPPRGTSRRKTA